MKELKRRNDDLVMNIYTNNMIYIGRNSGPKTCSSCTKSDDETSNHCKKKNQLSGVNVDVAIRSRDSKFSNETKINVYAVKAFT